MMLRNQTARRAVAAALTAIVVFMFVWMLIQYVLMPRLPAGWQNFLVLAALALVATITILAGLAQLSGYSLKDFLESAGGDRASHPESAARRLIEQIQEELYADDADLPHVLTLCLDLCQRLALPPEHAVWLRRELGGYRNRDELAREIGGDERFEAWMQHWASHRLVQTHVKFSFYSEEAGRPVIEDWPFEKILVGYALPQVVEMKQSAANPNARSEFGVSLRQLDRARLQDLQVFFARHGFTSSDDVQVFFTDQGLTGLLNGVRAKVLSLLEEARALVEKEEKHNGRGGSTAGDA